MTNELMRDEVREDGVSSAKPADEISLLDLLIALAERKRIILLCIAASVVLAVAISLLLPAKYTATVTIMTSQQSSSASAALASQLGSMAQLAGSGLGLKNPNDAYVALLKSETVKAAMVQKYGLKDEYKAKRLSDACKAFEKNAMVDGSGKDGLIHISVTDLNPNRAAELANGYVEQFRSFSQQIAVTEAAQRRLFFEQQLKQAKDQLSASEDALKATEQTTGLIEVNSQSRALIEQAASMRARIAAQEIQIKGMRTYASNQNAELQKAQEELTGMRSELAKLGGSGDPSDSLNVSKKQITSNGLDYLRKLRDVQYNETIFELLAKQLEMAKIDEAKQGAVIQVIDPAVAPDRRSSPKRAMIVISATLIGSFIGILLALLQATLQHMQTDPELSDKLSVFGRLLSFRK